MAGALLFLVSNKALAQENFDGINTKNIDCNDGIGNSLWIKGKEQCDKVKSGQLNAYDKRGNFDFIT